MEATENWNSLHLETMAWFRCTRCYGNELRGSIMHMQAPPPPAFPVLECGSPPSVFSFSLALGINQTVSLHGNCSLHKSQLAHKKQSQQVRFTLHVDVQAMVSRKPHLPALYVAANCALPQEWKHTYTLKTGGENIHPSIAFYWLVLTTATTHDFSDIWSSPMINTI